MKKIISIIGCGAVGAAQLSQLVEQIIDDHNENHFEILVFEKSTRLGQGLAYGKDDDNNILNRNAKNMSLHHFDTRQFAEWLSDNKSKYKEEFPRLKLSHSKENFLPRFLFGLYIEDVLQETVAKARKNKLKVSIIHDQVLQIKKDKSRYKIYTENEWEFSSHYVILTIGNLSSDRFHYLERDKRFFNTPYPTHKFYPIPSKFRVGIIGSSLSAVDAAIALKENGHNGEILFISRNGYLPTVRSPYRRHVLRVLTKDFLNKRLSKGKLLTLPEIIKLLIKEVSLAYGARVSFKKWFRKPKVAVDYYAYELKNYNSKINSCWQAVLIELNDLVEEIWHNLSQSHKETFVRLYKSKWMAYRVGIPLQNAQKIYDLLCSRQLKVVSNYQDIYHINNDYVVESAQGKQHFDFLIDASGCTAKLKDLNSPLLNNLLQNGLIKPHQFGGIDLDFDTSRALNSHGLIDKNFFVIGNLTSGVYFFTSVLELNIKHAYKIAGMISSEYKEDYQHRVSIRKYPYYQNSSVYPALEDIQ